MKVIVDMNMCQDHGQCAIAATAAPHAPWFVVPADEQWESRAVVGDLVREQLEAMDPQVPVLSAKTRTELAEAKKMLEAE